MNGTAVVTSVCIKDLNFLGIFCIESLVMLLSFRSFEYPVPLLLSFTQNHSKYEPLIEKAGDGNVDELLELAGEQATGAGAADPLSIWWEYIQAVQDNLPTDQQVLKAF